MVRAEQINVFMLTCELDVCMLNCMCDMIHDMFMPTIKCRLMTSSCLLYLHMSTNDELQLLGESYFLAYKTGLLIRETGELYARKYYSPLIISHCFLKRFW